MDLNSLKKVAFFSKHKDGNSSLANKILADQIRLFYKQNSFGIIIHFLAAIFLAVSLWNVSANYLVISWLFYMFLVYTSWYVITHYYRQNQNLATKYIWFWLLAFFAFIAGVGWGFAGSVLVPANNLLHQTFVLIIIFAITAGSIPFFSPITFIYALFLFPTIIPFVAWLFFQGGVYILLGLCGLIYIPIIFACCYFVNKFLINTLTLRYKNINLDTLNQLLEERVSNRANELERALAITKSTLESTADGILVIDLKGHVEYYNQKFLDMWQIPQIFITNPNLQFFISEALKQIKSPNEFLKILEENTSSPSHEIFDEIIIDENRVFEWYSKPHWMRNIIVGRTWSFRDITLRKQMERQLAFQATHDLLTGLPNRTLLFDRINQGIAYAKRYQTKLFLLFLDIDNFKLINDNLGHNIGDILLKEVAKRLTQNTRESDTVARFGGDEFIILFITNKYSDVIKLTQKMLDTVTRPMQLSHQEIVVTASIGVSLYPKDGTDAANLLKNADIAMYLAKNQGRNNYRLYDQSMKRHTEKSLAMQIELRNALANNEFFLLYQPIIDLKSGQIVGVEALVRWKHPRKGVIHPLQFIPIAEESRIIVPLGEWIFRNACLQNKDWQNRGLKQIYVAINVSGVQLTRENFVDQIELALDESKLDPKYVEIELTETTIMDNRKQNLQTLQQLNKIGINLAIDDFGTGYSSLNYLRAFPISKLKIDQSFVQNCIHDYSDASLVEAIIAMGHGLKLKVLAEGIETVEQLRLLNQCACDEGQGFLYGQPMSAKAFAKLLSSNLQYDHEN
ncbi:putative bifunctional diguanylate cyclase/phosphodiesterase [Legionella micdadei]|uniref:cyclic-guanylate-specific phosphodiesterase n=1 Tax=Legionella micdadei TaxID=451 RepID=A0A098GDT0_LEGMI|nr:bifunctional diguanylate cyclase/phosphodiesterase [Legionella micdadei]ARG96420.1 diguanylate cyclase [Legionella micdadei]KTD29492.1 inner membrane protein [Legionella micdadei]CEG59626.1 Diguanylate cyclase [Legionella micdadei]SCX95774.1 diguanylate cyclase (GGDEF) domain-containing protein [Legionella micdadei]